MHLSKQELLNIAKAFSHEEGTCLLYSGSDFDSAEQSILGLFPYDTIKVHNEENPWNILKNGLDDNMWMGFLGYEMGNFADPDARHPYIPAETPDLCFYKHAVKIFVDHKKQKTTIQSPQKDGRFIKKGLLYPDYEKIISKTKEYIRNGDIYQTNITQEFIIENESAPFDVFCNIANNNPAPFMAFLNCGDFCVVSSSPERFLQKKGPYLETRPIKGTAPRSNDHTVDLLNKKQLLNSPKERAELLMITDLMRNDLGRISLPGTVKTEKIWHCEAYTNVYHLLSVIRSQVLPDIHPVDLIRLCFPGGSISGCPKLRALEIIAEQEQQPRGIHTGSIGYFKGNGDFDFNIAIRTMVVRNNLWNIRIGGGIVFDSVIEKEYEEVLHKGLSIFEVLGVQQ
jgi:para-aminobenzoate synthetase component I